MVVAPPIKRRSSQKVEAPWISLLIVPDETPRQSIQVSGFAERFRRLSTNIAYRHGSSSAVSSDASKTRRYTFCYGHRLTVPDSDALIELIQTSKSKRQFENNNILNSRSNGVIPV